MKWKDMRAFQKVLFAVRILCCLAAIVFIVLDENGSLENGNHYTLLLLAVSSVIYSIQFWKEKKGFAVSGLAVAAFMFACLIYLFFFNR